MKTISKISVILVAFFIIHTSNTSAQVVANKTPSAKERSIKRLLESRDYVFNAQTVQSTSIQAPQLNAGYFLQISKNKLNSYLPYFGVAYQAPMNVSQSPLDFSSSDFEYSSETAKKGRIEISIKLKDVNDPRRMDLSVSSSGYATLTVISNNRQPISFYGVISARRS